MADGGFGPTLYTFSYLSWNEILGTEDGAAVFNLLLSYRNKKGALPKGYRIPHGSVSILQTCLECEVGKLRAEGELKGRLQRTEKAIEKLVQENVKMEKGNEVKMSKSVSLIAYPSTCS